MTTYQFIDFVCDLVNPVLLLIALVMMGCYWFADKREQAQKQVIMLIIGMVCIYGFMFLDQWLSSWPRFGADYSTHTAFAVVMAITITYYKPTWRLPLAILLVTYGAGMLYQQYHSLLDILSTATIVGGVFLLFCTGGLNRKRL